MRLERTIGLTSSHVRRCPAIAVDASVLCSDRIAAETFVAIRPDAGPEAASWIRRTRGASSHVGVIAMALIPGGLGEIRGSVP